MTRRDSSDSNTLPQPIRRATERTPSQSLFGHFTSLANSVQRRLSGGPPSSTSSSVEEASHSFSRGTHHELDPPLSPISLHGFSPSTHERVMSDKLAEEIRLMMPTRLQLQDRWDLVYSLEQHGVSLATLYARSKAFNSPQAGYVVVVRDRGDHVFGAYLTDYPHVHPHYYGTGECFLFKFKELQEQHHLHSSPYHSHLGHTTIHKSPSSSGALSSSSTEISQMSQDPSQHSGSHSPPPSTETSHLSILTAETSRPSSADGPQYQFKGFSYTGLNDYMILCTPQFLSVGGGYIHYT
jgi:hypothetical protein